MSVGNSDDRDEKFKLCHDVHPTWGQVLFFSVIAILFMFTTIDLLTTCYLLDATEALLAWLDDQDTALIFLFYIFFGTLCIIALVPQTLLFIGAGYVCAARIEVSVLAFVTAVLLSMATFMIGGTLAFLLSRRMLDPSCTRKVIRHSKVLDGLDHALQYRGRRINLLLRINPFMPYNALNYALGLSLCSLYDFVLGMLGALPFSAASVYAGMVIDDINDIENMFSHTGTVWYLIYASFALLFVVSCVALVVYTGAEMKALVCPPRNKQGVYLSAGDREGSDVGDGAQSEGDRGFMGVTRGLDSTTFGTFVSDESLTDTESVAPVSDEGTSRVPLLVGTEAGRKEGAKRLLVGRARRLSTDL